MFRTPAFEAFVAPARTHPEIWRIVLGLVVGVIVYVLGTIALIVGAGLMVFGTADEAAYILVDGDTPVAMLVLLSTFLCMGLGAVAAAGAHRRGLASLIGPFRPACRNFSRAIIGCVVVYLVSGAVVGVIAGLETMPNLPWQTWLFYMPLALPLLLVQTGSEELFFRGYLMQSLAARFSSPRIWMGLPTVLFGLAHTRMDIAPVLTVLLICATGLFGLVAADLTRKTGNLGAAIGFHFANNFFAIFLVAIAGELSGLSLYLAPFTMEDVDILVPLIAIDMLTVVMVWVLLRRWLAPQG